MAQHTGTDNPNESLALRLNIISQAQSAGANDATRVVIYTHGEVVVSRIVDWEYSSATNALFIWMEP